MVLGFRVVLAAILIYFTIEWAKLSGFAAKSLIWTMYLVGGIIIVRLIIDAVRLRKKNRLNKTKTE